MLEKNAPILFGRPGRPTYSQSYRFWVGALYLLVVKPSYPSHFSTRAMTKQPILAAADAEPPLFLGVDVGGTNTKIGLVDNQGKTLAFESIETREEDGPGPAVERMAGTCRRLCAQVELAIDDIPYVGLGTPGTMCLQRGMLLHPPNLPHWFEFPIRDELSRATGRPVAYVNDANAAAFGEFWIGTGARCQSLALLTLGTGVGGGLISEGRLINGVNSFGSETGHIIVDCRPDARLCVWGGGRGHLEAYASASAVAAIAEERLDAGGESSLKATRAAEGKVTARMVYEAARAGDTLALQIVDETAFYLGVGITTTVHSVDPGLVVLGGAMDFGGRNCPVGQRFLQGIIDEFERRTFSNVFAGTRIEFASLGGDAGYLGAAGIARQAFYDHRERELSGNGSRDEAVAGSRDSLA